MDSLMHIALIDIRILDVFDILIVAYLMYRIYDVLKGSLAFNIFVGVLLMYLVYWLVQELEMNLLSLLLGKFMSFGVLILIIIFQPEIRRFLLAVGNSTLKGRMNILDKWFNPTSTIEESKKKGLINTYSNVLNEMSRTHTGALIIVEKENVLQQYIATGTPINGKVSTQLILNLFFKNSPLHDGAVIVKEDIILAASCILPITQRTDLPSNLGLRHRAAIGISEMEAIIAFVVSEENGKISIAQDGEIKQIQNDKHLRQLLKKWL